MYLHAMFLGPVMAAITAIPVEVWTAAEHSGQAQKLQVAIERAFQDSALFTLSSEERPGTLYVTFPLQMDSRDKGGRTEITVSVGIAHAPPNAPEEIVGQVKCWDDDMSACGLGAVALAAKLAKP